MNPTMMTGALFALNGHGDDATAQWAFIRDVTFVAVNPETQERSPAPSMRSRFIPPANQPAAGSIIAMQADAETNPGELALYMVGEAHADGEARLDRVLNLNLDGLGRSAA